MWFRRDLRVDDNPALVAALNAAAYVIPVFIWAPEEEGQFQPGRCTRWWTKHSLVDLQQALAALGSRLIIRRSTDSTAALLQVVKEVGAEAVFFNHLYDPISLMRDHDCKRGLSAASVAHRTFNGDMLYEPWEVLDANKQPLSTFNDYWNSVKTMATPPPFPLPAPETMTPVPANVASMAVTEVDWYFTAEQEASSDQLKFKWKPGVGGAIQELERFAGERLFAFEHDRAKVDRDSTSRLSPWIHIGSISVRYIFYRVRQCQAEWLAAGVDRSRSCDDFLQQVGYREYSRYLSFHFPFIHERSLLRHLRACPWRIDQVAFKAWRQGQTGYPLVDAAMRQLWSSGWCHNRARVVAASFLVKDLLLPWQWGLKHYWDAQIDADLECDSLGWQYVSGGMSDAHPFSYMMDLEKEALRFDPDGEYVRRWLPVLSRLPTEFIHCPWKAPPQVLAAADVELGCNYPNPIITRDGAKANVAYACSVLEQSAGPQHSESSGRYPYRAPTYPNAAAAQAAAAAGASSGANPTPAGTATGANGGAGSKHESGGSGLPSGSENGAQGPNAHGPSRGNLPDSRTVSAAHGGAGASSGGGMGGASGPGQGLGVGSMGPPPPQSRPSGAPPGGAVYYHPGESAGAGHDLLERILQQQRRARVAPRQPDGSGTNHPPKHPSGTGTGTASGAGAGAASEAGDDEAAAAAAAAAAWQEQLAGGGAAAYALEQAMEMILARRRMGDGVSQMVGDLARAVAAQGGDAMDGDDEDSEEVVSNTVDLNLTAFTGASCLPRGGTAKGAREAMARARKRAGEALPDKDEESEGEAGGSPGGWPRHEEAMEEAEGEADADADGEAHHPAGREGRHTPEAGGWSPEHGAAEGEAGSEGAEAEGEADAPEPEPMDLGAAAVGVIAGVHKRRRSGSAELDWE